MPIFKTKIFDQLIDLNYQEEDKSKLLNLIESLNFHWTKYDHLKGKVSNSKILILLTLELQDALFDLKNISKKNNDKNIKSQPNDKEINKLSKEFFLLKHKHKTVVLSTTLKK